MRDFSCQVTAVCLDIIILFSFLEKLLFLSKLLSCIVSSRDNGTLTSYITSLTGILTHYKRSRYSSLESITSLYSFQWSFSKNKKTTVQNDTIYTIRKCMCRKKNLNLSFINIYCTKYTIDIHYRRSLKVRKKQQNKNLFPLKFLSSLKSHIGYTGLKTPLILCFL